jgi:hypothetical protein
MAWSVNQHGETEVKNPENIGRAKQLVLSGPEGSVNRDVLLQWLTQVAYFLLNRYISGD